VFSVNVPLPPAVGRIANDLHPKLAGFDRVRERHTLACKRVDADDVVDPDAEDGHGPDRARGLERLRESLHPVLAGIDPFDAAITGIDAFEAPTAGPGPVVHLTVESGPLVRLHRRLCTVFDPVAGIEGDAYVPHVTLARGGEPVDDAVLGALVDVDIDPIVWRVDALDLYDAAVREVAGRIDL
jgi:hypothetical protein